MPAHESFDTSSPTDRPIILEPEEFKKRLGKAARIRAFFEKAIFGEPMIDTTKTHVLDPTIGNYQTLEAIEADVVQEAETTTLEEGN